MPINLFDAKFDCLLAVTAVQGLSDDSEIVLRQMGIFPERTIAKIHAAPLGDPVTIKIGKIATSATPICH